MVSNEKASGRERTKVLEHAVDCETNKEACDIGSYYQASHTPITSVCTDFPLTSTIALSNT